jgi:hypothetical protein
MRNLTVVLLFVSWSLVGCATTKPRSSPVQKPPLFKEFKVEVRENNFDGRPSITASFRINNLTSLYPNGHHEENQTNH